MSVTTEENFSHLLLKVNQPCLVFVLFCFFLLTVPAASLWPWSIHSESLSWSWNVHEEQTHSSRLHGLLKADTNDDNARL